MQDVHTTYCVCYIPMMDHCDKSFRFFSNSTALLIVLPKQKVTSIAKEFVMNWPETSYCGHCRFNFFLQSLRRLGSRLHPPFWAMIFMECISGTLDVQECCRFRATHCSPWKYFQFEHKHCRPFNPVQSYRLFAKSVGRVHNWVNSFDQPSG